MNKVGSYFNPFSTVHHALTDFKKLSLDKQVVSIALSAFAAIATFWMGFLGGLATFRILVEKFSTTCLNDSTQNNPSKGSEKSPNSLPNPVHNQDQGIVPSVRIAPLLRGQPLSQTTEVVRLEQPPRITVFNEADSQIFFKIADGSCITVEANSKMKIIELKQKLVRALRERKFHFSAINLRIIICGRQEKDDSYCNISGWSKLATLHLVCRGNFFPKVFLDHIAGVLSEKELGELQAVIMKVDSIVDRINREKYDRLPSISDIDNLITESVSFIPLLENYIKEREIPNAITYNVDVVYPAHTIISAIKLNNTYLTDFVKPVVITRKTIKDCVSKYTKQPNPVVELIMQFNDDAEFFKSQNGY